MQRHLRGLQKYGGTAVQDRPLGSRRRPVRNDAGIPETLLVDGLTPQRMNGLVQAGRPPLFVVRPVHGSVVLGKPFIPFHRHIFPQKCSLSGEFPHIFSRLAKRCDRIFVHFKNPHILMQELLQNDSLLKHFRTNLRKLTFTKALAFHSFIQYNKIVFTPEHRGAQFLPHASLKRLLQRELQKRGRQLFRVSCK